MSTVDRVDIDWTVGLLCDIAVLHDLSRRADGSLCHICRALWPCRTYRLATGQRR